MDNGTMACLLNETADLMEIDGADSFRVRSYRNAADAVEQTTVDLAAVAGDVAQLLAIQGIGKSMAANLQAIVATGSLPVRDELLTKYGAGLLELLKLPGMGPKTVALLWDAGKIKNIDELAEAIDAGRLKGLPRMGEKQIEKIKKGIDDYRRSVGRFRIDEAEDAAERLTTYLMAMSGIERVTPAGSLRRGRETAGRSGSAGDGPCMRAGQYRCGGGVRGRVSGDSRHDCEGREQGELPPSEWAAGGCAVAAFALLWGGAAVLHRDRRRITWCFGSGR